MAGIFYTDAPVVDDAAYIRHPSPAPARRSLRNWQKFSLSFVLMYVGIALIAPAVTVDPGANAATRCFVTMVFVVYGAAVHVVTLLAARAVRKL